MLYEGVTYDRDGCVLMSELGNEFSSVYVGAIPVVVDLENDGTVELVLGGRQWEWDRAARRWIGDPGFMTVEEATGHTAVADFGTFAVGEPARAEVALVRSGTLQVQDATGRVLFGPLVIPGGGNGGPPTIADFDGDGRPEVATAGGAQYVVFDLDCRADPGMSPGTCASGRTDGILWTAPSQDQSSNVTGSSVFDFDADGAAEVVYADECFLRSYRGADGTVLYSAPRSSGTAFENPVIVDSDGDFHTEIVSSVNDYYDVFNRGLGCPPTDPLRASTAHALGHGVVVLRDVMDRWAASRPVWNQHAYFVSNVGDRGQIAPASSCDENWRAPALNNFRQNVQGGLAALGIPDLTATAVADRLRVECDPSSRGTLRARVCNRGSLPMRAGFEITFRSGARDGAELCAATSATVLAVGACSEELSCLATLPADRAVDVYVVVDPRSTLAECYEGNNFGLQPNVACNTID